MPGKQLTIIDIAQKLNLSKSTVSRALRDSYDVNPETRRKVLELVKELDFEPNSIAMSLRQHKTFTIGVVIPSFRIPFYSGAISGIQDIVSGAGYNVMTCQSNESSDSEISHINSLVRSRVDGIIISLSKETTNFNHIRRLKEKGLPVVLFNRINNDLELPSVSVNDYKSARTATEYLIQRGCRRIAHIAGPLNLKLTDDRKAGYLDCLKEFNIIQENMVIESDFSIKSGEKAAVILAGLPQKPDAVFCVCDAVAFGAIKAFRNLGIRVPEDISVMGYTDEPVSEMINPPLSTITQPIFEIGQTAARLLLKVIEGKTNAKKPERIELETSLRIRSSVR